MDPIKFAVISMTEYYGPATSIALVSLHDTQAEAQATIPAMSPDYDPSVQAVRLSHNQSSATCLRVVPVLAESFSGFYSDWSDLPGDIYSDLPEGIGADTATADEELAEALTERGFTILVMDGDPYQYLVKVAE